MADSPRVAYEKAQAQKVLQGRIDRLKEDGYKTKKELFEERVAQQKTNTGKLLTPGTLIKGLVGTNTAPFDATSTTLNGIPALSAKGSFIEQNNQFGKPGYLPKSIQYAGSTLYGMQKGDTIFYPAKNKTPLMESFKAKIEAPELNTNPDPDPNSDPNADTAPITSTGPQLDPNATKQYASNFKAGKANKDAMQDYFKGQKNGENLAMWAKANPALAYKEYSKAMGKAKAADMDAYKQDYGSPMNQQSEVVFEQGKPTVTTTSQYDVLNSPNELSAPGKAAYDLAMDNTNFIGQQDIPAADNTQEFLATMMKKLGLVK